jgi:hypothetical protein
MSDTVSSGDGGEAIHRGDEPVTPPVTDTGDSGSTADSSGSDGDEAIHRG